MITKQEKQDLGLVKLTFELEIEKERIKKEIK